MITVIRHFDPFPGHIFGSTDIFFSYLLFAKHFRHLSVTSHSQNRFYRKIGIMCQMTGKIIRTQLVLRIQPGMDQVICPYSQRLPVFSRIIGIAFYLRNGSSQQNHIPCFLDRHIATVQLTVGNRIGTQVMCRERLGPAPAFAIIENRSHHPFQQIGIINQE